LDKTAFFKNAKKVFIVFKDRDVFFLELDPKIFDISDKYAGNESQVNVDQTESIEPRFNLFKPYKIGKESMLKFSINNIEEIHYENSSLAMVSFKFEKVSINLVMSDDEMREDLKRFLAPIFEEEKERVYVTKIETVEIQKKKRRKKN